MSDVQAPSLFDRLGIRPVELLLIVGMGWMFWHSQQKPAAPTPSPTGLGSVVTDAQDRARLAAVLDAASLAIVSAPAAFDTRDELTTMSETLFDGQIKGRLNNKYPAIPGIVSQAFAPLKTPGPLTAADRQQASSLFKTFAEQLR